jgi:hypothetical protein
LVLALGLRRLHGAQIYTMTAIASTLFGGRPSRVLTRTHAILPIGRSQWASLATIWRARGGVRVVFAGEDRV